MSSIHKIALFTSIIIAIPLKAQADESFNTRLAIDCDCLRVTVGQCEDFAKDIVVSQADTLAQSRRTRRTRRTTSSSKYYGGGSLGIFSSSGIGDAGFGGSIFGGRKFDDRLSAEAEVIYYRGGTSVDDLGYSILGVLGNAKYLFPFDSSDSQGFYAFAGAGIGLGRFALTGDFADFISDTDSIALLIQAKGGVGYPVSKNIDVFGQLRYLNTTTSFARGFSGNVTGDGFSFDGGATFKF